MKKDIMFYLTGFLLIAICLAESCKQPERKPGRPAGNPGNVLIVDGVIIKPVKLQDFVYATANLKSFEEVELKAPVSGTVLEIYFKEGQIVTKGQPLIKMDDRSWKAQIKGARAQLVKATSELTRKKELLKVGGASQEDVDNARAAVEALEAQIEQLTVNVSLANVVAPFDGKLGMRNFSIGSFLSQGTTITLLSQSQKLKVDFSISSRYLDKLRIGNDVEVVVAGDTITAEIYAINPVISETSRTIQVRAIVETNRKNLVPGNFAEIIVPINIDNHALVVPSNCLVPEISSQTVYSYKNGRALRKTVILGTRLEKVVQILDGVSSGDTILTTGLVQIKDQMPVQIGNVSEIKPL